MDCQTCHMTIVIVYRLDTNGYPTVRWKGTGSNGRRKNIGTGTVSMTTEDTVNRATGAMVIRTAKAEMNKKAGIKRTKADEDECYEK